MDLFFISARSTPIVFRWQNFVSLADFDAVFKVGSEPVIPLKYPNYLGALTKRSSLANENGFKVEVKYRILIVELIIIQSSSLLEQWKEIQIIPPSGVRGKIKYSN